MLSQPAIETETGVETPRLTVVPERQRAASATVIDRIVFDQASEEALAEGDFLDSGFDGFGESFEEAERAEMPKADRVQLAARERILNHVLQLRDLGRTHLDITFQPDEDTTINLHLQSIDGEIVITAQLEQGGPEIAAEWNRLQRSLARDGIQLRDLETAADRDRQKTSQDPASDQDTSGHGRQNNDSALADTLLASDAATILEPFPGVVAANESGSTWQAWS